jgi:hypothetical protein
MKVRRMMPLTCLVSMVCLTSCISFGWIGRDDPYSGTHGVKYMATGPQAHVSIHRNPTRRLVSLYWGRLRFPNGSAVPCPQTSRFTRSKCVTGVLATMESKIGNDFARDRWRAAIADDQIRGDMDVAIEESIAAGKCLTVSVKANLLNQSIGYNWTTRNVWQDACKPGADPVSGFLPPL